ncbi:hypothetical protein P4114_02250 [Pseudomonas aeruginosa]|nr:hypothetical protein [Pseudomonas aeruginosa]
MKDNKLAATHEQPVKNGARPYEISFFSIFTFVLDIQPSRSAMARLPCMQQGEVQENSGICMRSPEITSR